MKRIVCVVSVILVGVVSAMIAGIAAEPKTSNAPFLKPAEAVAKMSIPEGFEVKIFAAEPDIAEPIAFCFDDRGRMWVAENLNYRTRRQHTNDQVSRIQIFEDTNGDGVFDKKKMFTDKYQLMKSWVYIDMHTRIVWHITYRFKYFQMGSSNLAWMLQLCTGIL